METDGLRSVWFWKGGGGTGCPASFSYGDLSFAFNFFPHAVDAGTFLVIPDDLCLSDIRDLKMAGDAAEPSFAFSPVPDLFRGGCLNDLDLWLPAETVIEDDQENYNCCYLKNMIHEHKITPCSDII